MAEGDEMFALVTGPHQPGTTKLKGSMRDDNNALYRRAVVRLIFKKMHTFRSDDEVLAMSHLHQVHSLSELRQFYSPTTDQNLLYGWEWSEVEVITNPNMYVKCDGARSIQYFNDGDLKPETFFKPKGILKQENRIKNILL
eukprot:8996036-Pyramimonas_sp.AAC.1